MYIKTANNILNVLLGKNQLAFVDFVWIVNLNLRMLNTHWQTLKRIANKDLSLSSRTAEVYSRHRWLTADKQTNNVDYNRVSDMFEESNSDSLDWVWTKACLLLLYFNCSINEVERWTVGVVGRKSSADCATSCISSSESWPAAVELSIKQDYSGRSGLALPLLW